MTAFSLFLENELLDHVLKNLNFSPTASIFIGLFTVAPDEDGAGGTEVTGGSYARLEAGAATGRDFTVAAAGTTSNNEDWTFATASASWGTVLAVGIFSLITAGDLYFHGPVSPSVTIDNGETFQFAAGDFDVTLN